jgi:2-C-methyl-D-erythritol 4-phosphate cytidylyltransferase
MKRYAVIVAGGSGSRMHSEIPKQFLLLAGEPILCHTIRKFRDAGTDISITVVLPENQILYWQGLCQQYKFNIPHLVVSGGKTRFHSVENGLLCCDDTGIVAIHDGVRPLVSVAAIVQSYQTAAQTGSAVLAIASKDSLRQKIGDKSIAVSRADFYLVQTPQTFDLALLRPCYAVGYQPFFTDDASVYEHSGFSVTMIEGNDDNIKITTPTDLRIAEMLIK